MSPLILAPEFINHPAGFGVKAVVFDGTNDFTTRGADLTGAADGFEGILSCWVKFNGGDGALQYFSNPAATGGNSVEFTRTAGNKPQVRLFKPGTAQNLYFSGTGNIVVASGWTHILASWDTNGSGSAKISQMYVDDVDVVSEDATGGAASVTDYTLGDWAIGAETDGGGKLNADMAEYYFNQATDLDLSVEANRRKFITAAGKPEDLGADGSLPTGSAPIIYHTVRAGDAASDFAANQGSGGNFSITGALTLAPTSPSD